MANYMHGYAPIQFLGVLLKLFPYFFTSSGHRSMQYF